MGDLQIIWNERDLKISVTNYTGGATPSISPSTPIVVKSTATGFIFYCKLFSIFIVFISEKEIRCIFDDN